LVAPVLLVVSVLLAIVVLWRTCGARTSKSVARSDAISFSVVPFCFPFGIMTKNVIRSMTWPGGSVGARDGVGRAVGTTVSDSVG